MKGREIIDGLRMAMRIVEQAGSKSASPLSTTDKANRYDCIMDRVGSGSDELYMLWRKADQLKGTDAEGWITGDLIQRLCGYAGYGEPA